MSLHAILSSKHLISTMNFLLKFFLNSFLTCNILFQNSPLLLGLFVSLEKTTSWYEFPLWNFRCGVCLMKLKAIWFPLCFPFNRMLSFPLRKSLKWTEELKDFKKPLFKAKKLFGPFFSFQLRKL